MVVSGGERVVRKRERGGESKGEREREARKR
jgi:hypothetical protein